MSEWMLIRQIYRGCNRTVIVRGLLLQSLLGLSGLVMLGYLLLALIAMVMVVVFFSNVWLALALPVVAIGFGLLGSLVVDDRMNAVYEPLLAMDRDIGTGFRRGFMGLRYLVFRGKLQDGGHFSPEVLAPALRCCDAERELAKAGEPRVSRARVILPLLLAVALAAVAPWAGFLGLAPGLLRLLAALSGLLAMCYLALNMAQPRSMVHGSDLEELRCLLAWALEDAGNAAEAGRARGGPGRDAGRNGGLQGNPAPGLPTGSGALNSPRGIRGPGLRR